MKIFKKILLHFFLGIISLPCFGVSLGDRLRNAALGDFMVTEQEKNISLLLVRANSKQKIILEEVTAPSYAVSTKTDWKQWLSLGAPGHTSWIMYEIDLESFTLLESYSVTKKGWLFIHDDENFLSQLLKLDLKKIEESERKKTGPAPQKEEPDRRKIWNPTVKIDGKKLKVECDAFRGRWPKDKTMLSSCDLQMYFLKNSPSFLWPYWIEASNGHYTYSIKTIDSGTNLASPISYGIPHRPPKFLNIAKKNSSIHFIIKSPCYYTSFELFAIDVMKPSEKIGPIPTSVKLGSQKELIELNVDIYEVSSYLEPGHRYKWLIIPDQSQIFHVESEDFFLWPSIASK